MEEGAVGGWRLVVTADSSSQSGPEGSADTLPTSQHPFTRTIHSNPIGLPVPAFDSGMQQLCLVTPRDGSQAATLDGTN
jgi:hypothetical protein